MYRCTRNGRVRHASYAAALASLDALVPVAKTVPSCYPCDACEGWHVSGRTFTVARAKGRGKSRRALVKKAV